MKGICLVDDDELEFRLNSLVFRLQISLLYISALVFLKHPASRNKIDAMVTKKNKTSSDKNMDI